MKRTHTCGELRKTDIDKGATLQGWINKSRSHGGVLFIDVRDRYGLTQIVIRPDNKSFKEAESLRRESVIEATGMVKGREQINPNITTGDVELVVDTLTVHCAAAPLPVDYDNPEKLTEEHRLKYRYLDLRRPEMQEKLRIRHIAALAAREYMSSKGFYEIETPLMVVSTPEGARDYVVPSRINPGKFYALPQSPQIFKQILMVSGFDRYFQLARCLRDEDLRKDRQPEHTQIDWEMSFPTIDDIFTIAEGLMSHIWKKTLDYDIKTPFRRISHQECLKRYGNDKPDLRFDLELSNVSDVAESSEFNVFKEIVKSGGAVKAICPQAQFTRKEIEEFETIVKQNGAKGIAAIKVNEEGLEGGPAKFFNQELQEKLLKRTGAKPGSTILMIADKIEVVNDCLARIRNELGIKLKLYNPKEFVFSWTTDFPFYEWNAKESKWDIGHNPFSMPKEKDIEMIDVDPGKVFCYQYDLVLNGVELCSGSIRNTYPELLAKLLKVVGHSFEDVKKKFGFMMEAFQYGVPPHGGMGLGFDRIVALLCYESDIREVIAFPKNKNAQCPMDGSPNEISKEQLDELHIMLKGMKDQAG
ncbi:MAG: aspartate--tRNA ligase [Candidatus Woesearchaeota archaeon]